jgi:hypothetical protein
MVDFQDLKNEALALDWAQRLRLAQHLLESLHDRPEQHPIQAEEHPFCRSTVPDTVNPAPVGRKIILPNPPQIPATPAIEQGAQQSIAESFQRLRAALHRSVED